LLPLTIVAMAMLLGVKSVALVRAAAPAMPAAAAPAIATPAAAAPAAVAMPNPAPVMPVVPAVQAAASPPAPTPLPPATATIQPLPAEPPISDSERALLLDLRTRQAELDARESGIASRESVVGAAEARLSARVAELTDLQTRLEGLDAKRHEHDEANWRSLVKLYETMKPRDAATIFNDLDLPVLVPILDRMKEAKAAAILGAMQPDRARLVTAELAQTRTRANVVPPSAAATAGAPPPAKSSGGG
jgi:flagellar motility protein MotE (MotC chaperone)